MRSRRSRGPLVFATRVVDVENRGVAALADGVDRSLEARRVGGGDAALQLALGEHVAGEEAGGPGGVGVGFEEDRGGGAEGTVGVALETAERQPLVAPTLRLDEVALRLPERDRRAERDAYRQLSGGASSLVDRPFGEQRPCRPVAEVDHRGDAAPRRFAQRGVQGVGELGVRRWRNDAEDEVHCAVFLQDAGRLAGRRVAHDHAAAGVLGVASDAGSRQGPRVGERHVPVEAGDEHRMVTGRRVDPLPRRQRRAGPALVVPGDIGDPAPGGDLPRVLGEAGDELLAARGETEVGAEETLAAGEEVGVAVDEAGEETLAAGVDDPGRGADERRDLGVGTDRDQALAAHGEGGGLGGGRWSRLRDR